LYRDAFRRVVVSELCGDDGAGRELLLDPRDRRRDLVVIRVERRWIGLTDVEIARAAEGVRPGSARAMTFGGLPIAPEIDL